MVLKGGLNKCTILCFTELIDSQLPCKVRKGVFTKSYCVVPENIHLTPYPLRISVLEGFMKPHPSPPEF